ncbi:MAG: response regulator [Lachnospiraceae bacterium]|nr:response regulator [Lachnospiraceae bacterium]
MRKEKNNKPTLQTRENAINELFAKLFFYSLPVCPIIYVLTQVGLFEVETVFCIILNILLIFAGFGMHFLNASENYSKYAKYFGIISLEIIIGFSASNATIGIYIAYSFAVMLSCLYISKRLTIVVNIISYIVLLISLYFRSLDQVRHNYIKDTAWRFFITYALGYTLECLVLLLISLTIIKYEKMLTAEATEEIEKRKKAELENRQKSEFLAEMSHEIRTPINAVIGMNEMILRESSEKNVIAYADTIKAAGKTLLTVVNDILDFSKIQSGKLQIVEEEYDTYNSILDMINLFGSQVSGKGLDFELQISENIPERLCGDEYRIKQVVGNLLSNAVKYTEKGFVNLRVDFKYDENDDNKGKVLISVIDSGIGIRFEDIPKLFTDYGRVDVEKNRKIEGTGLGLKISRQLVDMMGGELNVSSVYGEGSVLSLEIPQKVTSKTPIGCFEERFMENVNDEARRENKSKVLAPNAEILIVDDNDMNLQVAESLLKRSQARVDAVISGTLCIEAVKKKHYDIIFLDHMMPVMDGIVTLHKLRDEYAEFIAGTTIVVLTANAIKGAREKYLDEGFDDYVSKPISTEELDRILTEYLPANKVTVEESVGEEVMNEDNNLPDLSAYNIDVKKALDLMDGEMPIFLEMVDVFLKDRPLKGEKLLKALNESDMPNYAIFVHALKSNARTVGAFNLGEMAYVEEMQSKDGNIDFIKSDYENLFKEWDKAIEGFKILMANNADEKADESEELPKESMVLLEKDEYEEKLLMTMACIEEYQQDQAINLLKDLRIHLIPDDVKECVDAALDALDQFKYEEANEIIKEYLTGLSTGI